jgi:hypothetical protein
MQRVNNRQELADFSNAASDMNMNRKSWHVNMGIFSKFFTQHFHKHKISGKVILRSDGSKAQCGSIFSFRIAVENSVLSRAFPVIVLATYSLMIRDFLVS